VIWNNAPARKIVIHFENPAFSTTKKIGNKNKPTRTASNRKYI
jgi:hypothetical protein